MTYFFRFIGCEIDPVHYETAVARLKNESPNVEVEGRGDGKRSLLAERPSRTPC